MDESDKTKNINGTKVVNTLEEALQYIDEGIRSIHTRYAHNIHALFSELSKRYVNLENYFLSGKNLRERGALLVYGIMTDFAEIPDDLLTSCVYGSMIHAASLAHDDVEDEAKIRRGYQTPNTALGNQAAVFMGDELIAQEILKCLDTSVQEINIVARILNRKERRARYKRAYTFLRSAQILHQAMGCMSRGQTEERLLQLDIRSGHFRRPLSSVAIDAIGNRLGISMYNKTGSLIRAFFQLGEIYGGVDSPEVSPFGEDRPPLPGLFGGVREKKISSVLKTLAQRIGYDFQRRDDIIDTVSDPVEMKKQTAMDLRNGILNSVHLDVFLSSESSEEEKNFIYDVLRTKHPSEKRVLAANEIVIKYGVPAMERRLEKRLQEDFEMIDELDKLDIHLVGKELLKKTTAAMIKRET